MFYVYTLADPRDGRVFYVGKGKGDRIDAHEREAKKSVESAKCSKIREIWAAGLRVEKARVAEYEDEAAAYAHEKRLIETLPDLTNGGRVTHRVEDVLIRLLALAVRAKHGHIQEPAGEFSKALYRTLIKRLDVWAGRVLSKYTLEEANRLLQSHKITLEPIAINE